MRGFAVGWALTAIGAAAALAAGYGPRVGDLPEEAHVLGHLVLFGVLAAALSGCRHTWALAAVVIAGAAVEAAQALAGGGASAGEAAYDVCVDALVGMAGLAIGGRKAVAVTLSAWLHPAIVYPLGLTATFYACERDLQEATGWAAVGVACFIPAALAWIAGVQWGWLSEPDLKDRAERPLLFALGCASAALFAAAARGLGAPIGVIEVADGMLLCAIALTALTLAGLKVSGHVAVSLLLAVAISPWSPRGTPLFLASGALLSWARVRGGFHRPLEVAGAWLLAAGALVLR